MATVRFEPSGIEVPHVGPGQRFIDITDEVPGTGVGYSCRAATCGTCRVRVLEGWDALEAPGEDEQDVLEILGAGPRIRLCCQIALRRRTERVVLRVCDSG